MSTERHTYSEAELRDLDGAESFAFFLDHLYEQSEALNDTIEACVTEGDDMGYLEAPLPEGPGDITGLRPVFLESIGLTANEVGEIGDLVAAGKDYVLAKTMSGEWGYLSEAEYEAEVENYVLTRLTEGDLAATA